MSDVITQRPPARGRGTSRGTRGGGAIGYSSRGGRPSTTSRTNGDSYETSKFDDIPIEDQGELGKLKQKYASQLAILKETFPTWTDEDLINPLEESSGDVQGAASLISEGHATQWSDVKKKAKDRPKSRAPASANADDNSRSTSRGGYKGTRGGLEGTRGGRGRGSEHRGSTRGRGGYPARDGKTNGLGGKGDMINETSETNTVNAEAPDWNAAPTAETGDEETRNDADWGDTVPEAASMDTEVKNAVAASAENVDANASLLESAKAATPVAPMSAAEKPAAKSSAPSAPPKKTWASMFKTPVAPAPAPVQQQPAPPKKPQSPIEPKTEASTITSDIAASTEEIEPSVSSLPPPPVMIPTAKKSPVIAPALPEIATPKLPEPQLATDHILSTADASDEVPEVPEITTSLSTEEALPPPSKDKLTEVNLEKLEDVAPAAPTSTAASTIASTPMPRELTPLPAASRGNLPPLHRAPGSRSGLRRIRDQQEAVVMPRENPVDRAAVQFGSMGLGGDIDDNDELEQPEKPETVAQPPQQSPIGQPKASLPISISNAASSSPLAIGSQPGSIGHLHHQEQQQAQQQQQQPISVPRAAPGLAAPMHASHSTPLSQSPKAPHNLQPQQPSSSQSLSQSLPHHQQGFGTESSKFDSFGQQQASNHTSNQPTQSSYGFPSQGTQQTQQGLLDSRGMPSEYSNFYASNQDRNAFAAYYNTPYGQQNQQQQAEQGASQNRSSSALGGGSGIGTLIENTQIGSTGAGSQQSGQSRFGTSIQGSEGIQATPSPGVGNGQQAPQHPSQYPMHPSYYPYYNYMSMYGYPGYGQNKFHGYGPSHQGFMSPGGFEHSSSPAGFGAFGGPSSQGRESSLADYGRSTSSQSHLPQQNQHTSSQYGSGSAPDYMSSSRQQGQLSGLGSQQYGLGSSQQGHGSHNEDTLKPLGENKAPSGPSANPAGAPGRPPSTSGMSGQGGQSQLPPQNQSQHQQQNPMGGAGYPHHIQGQSQHNALMGGGLSNQGGHHNSGYGMYGGFGSYPQYGSQGANRQGGGGGWGYGH